MDRKLETIGVLAKLVGRSVEDVKPEMDLVADLGMDSPKSLQLLVELEDRLSIEIPDEAAARMQTVGDVLEYVATA